jgi:hypothetical protein
MNKDRPMTLTIFGNIERVSRMISLDINAQHVMGGSDWRTQSLEIDRHADTVTITIHEVQTI